MRLYFQIIPLKPTKAALPISGISLNPINKLRTGLRLVVPGGFAVSCRRKGLGGGLYEDSAQLLLGI
jgi:hypothetical protein